MRLSRYTEELVGSLIETGEWDELSPEKRAAFIRSCEAHVADTMVDQIGSGKTIVNLPEPKAEKPKGEPKIEQHQPAAAAAVPDVGDLVSKVISGVMERFRVKSESNVEKSKETQKTTESQPQVAAEPAKEVKTEAKTSEPKAEKPKPESKPEPKPEMKKEAKVEQQNPAALFDSRITNEYGRAAMHMTWEALKAAGVTDYKKFTEGFLDKFAENSEAVLNKLYSDAKNDGPRPEPVIAGEVSKATKPKKEKQQQFATPQAELIEQHPEPAAAATMIDAVGRFIQPAQTTAQVSIAAANPASRQQQSVIAPQVIAPITPAITVPYPADWKQKTPMEQAIYLTGLALKGTVPTFNGVEKWDSARLDSLKNEVNSRIQFMSNLSLMPVQLLGLIGLLRGNTLPSKLFDKFRERAPHNPILKQVSVSKYAKDEVGNYDLAFIVDPVNWTKQDQSSLLILINTVPVLCNNVWNWNTKFTTVKRKQNQRKPVATQSQNPQQQIAQAAANATMPNQQASGLGMGITIGDVYPTLNQQ